MHTPPPARKAYPTDVRDDAWALVAPYLAQVSEEALLPLARSVIRTIIAVHSRPSPLPWPVNARCYKHCLM